MTTTSAALITASVSGLGNSALMSSPISSIAATTTGSIRSAGTDPAERTPIHPFDSLWARHAAIWLRPALRSHTNNTSGSGFSTTPVACATAHSCSRANRSMITGKKFGPTAGRSPTSV